MPIIYRARVFNKYSTLNEVYMPIIAEHFSTSTELIPGTIFYARGATWLAVHVITRAQCKRLGEQYFILQ
jgi:hypothetical protein